MDSSESANKTTDGVNLVLDWGFRQGDGWVPQSVRRASSYPAGQPALHAREEEKLGLPSPFALAHLRKPQRPGPAQPSTVQASPAQVVVRVSGRCRVCNGGGGGQK